MCLFTIWFNINGSRFDRSAHLALMKFDQKWVMLHLLNCQCEGGSFNNDIALNLYYFAVYIQGIFFVESRHIHIDDFCILRFVKSTKEFTNRSQWNCAFVAIIGGLLYFVYQSQPLRLVIFSALLWLNTNYKIQYWVTSKTSINVKIITLTKALLLEDKNETRVIIYSWEN